MSDPTATAERREEILGELAEWMHAAAREAQRRLLAAETTDDFVKLTGSMAKLARGVRQSILIHRKLEAERLDAARRVDRDGPRVGAGSLFIARHEKRQRLHSAVTDYVGDDFEADEEAELFREELNARLDELQGEDDFLDVPIDNLIAQLCDDLGFEPPNPPSLGVDREARGADARSASEARTAPDPAGSARGEPSAAEPTPEGASPARNGAAVRAPNTS